MTGAYLAQQLANGLILGSLYALIAVGFTMIYGIVRLINFAHGDVLMVGAFGAFALLVALELPFWATMVAVLALGALLPSAARPRSTASSPRSGCRS
jgi:branched-chain amino acid transport system permease protein